MTKYTDPLQNLDKLVEAIAPEFIILIEQNFSRSQFETDEAYQALDGWFCHLQGEFTTNYANAYLLGAFIHPIAGDFDDLLDLVSHTATERLIKKWQEHRTNAK